MPDIVIPEDRARRHGGDSFYTSGAKFAETFEVQGGLKATDRVLDIGCGPGRMAIGIGEHFGWSNSYVGFDIISIDVDICQKEITSRYPDFHFHHLDVYNGLYNKNGTIKSQEVIFPADDNSADFAFATSVFTHMFKADVTRYLQEVSRALDIGGTFLSSWFILDEAVEENIKNGLSRFPFEHLRADGVRYNDPKIPEEVVAFQLRDALQMIHQAGLTFHAFYRGDWGKVQRTPKPRHSQDVLVCKKLHR